MDCPKKYDGEMTTLRHRREISMYRLDPGASVGAETAEETMPHINANGIDFTTGLTDRTMGDRFCYQILSPRPCICGIRRSQT